MSALVSYLKTVAKAIVSGAAALIGTIVLALDLQPADHQGVQYLTQSQWGIIILAVLASFGITWRVPNGDGGLPGEVTTTDPNTVTSTNNSPAVNTGAPATKFPAAAIAASQPVLPPVVQAQTPPANTLEPVQYLGGQQ